MSFQLYLRRRPTLPLFILVFVSFARLCATATGEPAAMAVAAYGNCVWDGRHDVGPCIQQAVEQAAKSGGTVEIPHGIWLIGEAIQMASNVNLRGGADGATLSPTADNNSNPVLLRAVNFKHIAIENLTFNGGGADFSNGNPIIAATSGQNIVFDHLIVQNAHGIGLLVQGGVSQSGISNSHFNNIGNHWKSTLNAKDRAQAVVFCCGQGNANNFAQNNHFSDIGLDALQFSNQDGFSAASNFFELENGEHRLIRAPDFPSAIFPMYSTNSEITGNSIHGAQGCGIDAPGLSHSSITNNTISASSACGIGLFLGYDKKTQTEYVKLSNNTVTNNVTWNDSPFKGGVTIRGGEPHAIDLEGNTIANTQNKRTQVFAIQVTSDTRLTDLVIGENNKLGGAGSVSISREDTVLPKKLEP
jgi:hypothetical protein